MELLYICDLKVSGLILYTLFVCLVAGALVRYVLCGVANM